jgi:hypothetical protein
MRVCLLFLRLSTFHYHLLNSLECSYTTFPSVCIAVSNFTRNPLMPRSVNEVYHLPSTSCIIGMKFSRPYHFQMSKLTKLTLIFQEIQSHQFQAEYQENTQINHFPWTWDNNERAEYNKVLSLLH